MICIYVAYCINMDLIISKLKDASMSARELAKEDDINIKKI